MPAEERTTREWDVALSFAGEQRDYVEKVAESLRSNGIRVFYDDFEQVYLWGKNLYEHLDYVYRKAAKCTVMFLSEDYARKVWTTHERRSAQARAFEENEEYILPVRVDGAEIPGFLPTIGYIDINSVTPDRLAQMIRQKIGSIRREDYLPPNPIALFSVLNTESEDEKNAILHLSRAFMQSLRRMSIDERNLMAEIMNVGCTEELPDNVHISLDLIRRDIGMMPAEVMDTLRGLSSVGIRITTADIHLHKHDDEDDDLEENDHVAIEWVDTSRYDDECTENFAFERSTEVAWAMLTLGNSYCLCHGREAVQRLDFSALARGFDDDAD